MLDINYIRENTDLVKAAAKNKGVMVDIDELLKLDERRRELIAKAEELRAQRNEISASSKGGKPSEEDIAKVRTLKDELDAIESTLEDTLVGYNELLRLVPNVPSEDTPIGFSEEENKILRQVGDKTEFSFDPRPNWEMERYVDQERATKISGSRFTYMKGGLAQLQMALMLWGMSQLSNEEVITKIVKDSGLKVSTKPFVQLLPPVMMRTDTYEATGRLKPDEVTFKLANDDLWLTASAEHAMCTYHMDETLAEEELPMRYAGYALSFRREVGSAGKDTRGIVRMHHFNKLEMESFTSAETSPDEHLFLIAVQEYLMQQLGLPYQVVLKCTFDMGGPNIRGVDIETWMPGQGRYIETHSADLLGDFQTRGLHTRVAKKDGSKELAHTNDATALADRTLVAILENYQTQDGYVIIPDVLKPYMNNKETL